MRTKLSKIITLLTLVTATVSASADTSPEWTSGPEQVTLIELYTSEGCSSCPPADAWLTRFASNAALWDQYVPLAFHVDYWDYLGWRDRFARRAFSDRQRRHRALDNLDAVYTPGFVVNGMEWRGFFNGRRQAVPVAGDKMPGRLSVTRTAEEIRVAFSPLEAGRGSYVANLAWLGFDLKNAIGRGENAGKTLTHNFVVLDHQSRQGATLAWRFPASPPQNARALAAWITEPGSLTPVQAIGGWLDTP